MSQRVPPLSFLLFCSRMYVYKSKRVLFYFFWHYATFFDRKNSKISSFFSKKISRFLSLRYSADFRRSRLVSSCMGIIWLKCIHPSSYMTFYDHGRFSSKSLNFSSIPIFGLIWISFQWCLLQRPSGGQGETVTNGHMLQSMGSNLRRQSIAQIVSELASPSTVPTGGTNTVPHAQNGHTHGHDSDVAARQQK